MLVQAAVEESPAALGWVARLEDEVSGYAPELVWLEVASALKRYVQAREIPEPLAQEVLQTVMRVPLNVSPLRPIAPFTLRAALALRVSVYDACYLVLAESLGATVVTADRRLARAVLDVELVR